MKELIISSAARALGNSSSFTIHTNNTFDLRQFGATKLRLKYVSMPDTFYNINASNCNISVSENEKSYFNIALQHGYYTAANLLTEICTLLTAGTILSNTYSYSIDSNTGILTISADTTDFRMLFLTGATAPYGPWRELGYVATTGPLSPVDSGPAATVSQHSTGFMPINIYWPSSIMIRMWINDNSKSNCFSLDSSIWSTFVIPRSSVHGSMLYYKDEPGSEQTIVLDDLEKQIRSIRVDICDENGQAVSLINTEWSLVLTIE